MPTGDQFACALIRALEGGCPGSRVELRGSRASGAADAHSDIDLAWVVPDDRFTDAIDRDRLGGIVGEVAPVSSIRTDPDFANSPRRRLIFVRFSGLPLFWRLDLEVWARSVAFDETVDADDPIVQGEPGSFPESACMNAIAAVKATLRGQPEVTEGLLSRGYARIGAVDPGGATVVRVKELARQAAAREERLTGLAEEISRLADRLA